MSAKQGAPTLKLNLVKTEMNDKPLPKPEAEEIKLGVNQWENELYASVSSPATFVKMWNEANPPKPFDWPKNQNYN